MMMPYVLHVAHEFDTGSTHDRRKVRWQSRSSWSSSMTSSASRSSLRWWSRSGSRTVPADPASIPSSTRGDNLRKRFWKFTPKAHLLDHLGEYQAPEWGNPAYSWCYPDEDLVGLMIEIAETS